jgi:long-subunit fatty acid transport protein
MNNYKNNFYPASYDYAMTTPAKAIVSSSYFFANPSKPTQPLGFISADLEWVRYAGTRFYSNDNDQDVVNYYYRLNGVIKDNYKNNINIKIGSEVKLNGNWMARAGTAFYGSPYKDAGFKASQFVLSGGIGYRTEKHFIDLTIMNTMVKDAIFPYRLDPTVNEKSSYYADFKGNNLIFNIGYGIRF